MTKYERHPAPEKLLMQVTTEAVNLLVWGLFEAAIRLEDAGERKTIYQLALLLADILDFDEWIGQCGPEEQKT